MDIVRINGGRILRVRGFSGTNMAFLLNTDGMCVILSRQLMAGGDDIGNLRPIHWENHRMKSNRYPVFRTAVTSSGEKNIHEERIWKIKS